MICSIRNWLVLVGGVFLAAGCAQVSRPAPLTTVVPKLDPKQSVAVTWFYDEQRGDVTALGDRWRDQVELALRNQGHVIKARKDLGLVVDEIFTFGAKDGDSSAAYEQGGADVVVGGSYSVIKSGLGTPRAQLTVKAYQLSDSSLLQGVSEEVPLPPDWAPLAAQVKKNVFQEQVGAIEDKSAVAGPKLKAGLNRTPACYPAGASGRVTVETDPGSYVYLLNLAADHTVTLLYPNRFLPDKALKNGKLEFPPAMMADKLELVFYPLEGEGTSQEGVKVIASRTPIDFSFLPIPEDAVYAGAAGGDIRKVAEVLKQSDGWSETVLSYLVGQECRP